MASNVQAGTRGLSASDWVRLKKLSAAQFYWIPQVPSPDPGLFVLNENRDVINPNPIIEPENGRRVHTEFGTSKIRRPASFWTDYRAAVTSDYVTERQDSNTKSRSLTATKVCAGGDIICKTESAIKHAGICITCKHEKRTNLQPLAQQPLCTNCGS